MYVYLLSRKGTLHKVVQAIEGIQSFEADNLDQTRTETFQRISDVPKGRIKRMCARCFPARV